MYASAPRLSEAVHSLVLSGELSWSLLGVECNEGEKNQENTREKHPTQLSTLKTE